MTALWRSRYGTRWENGPECGFQVLFGPCGFTQSVGNAKISGHTGRVTINNVDARFNSEEVDATRGGGSGGGGKSAGTTAAPGTTRLRNSGCGGTDADDDSKSVCDDGHAAAIVRIPLVWRYGQVQIDGTMHWVDSEHKVKFNGKRTQFYIVKTDRLDAVKRDRGRLANVRLFCRPRNFYDLQMTAECAVKGPDTQKKLANGNTDEWDLTMTFWLLLNSAHDGKDYTRSANCGARSRGAAFVNENVPQSTENTASTSAATTRGGSCANGGDNSGTAAGNTNADLQGLIGAHSDAHQRLRRACMQLRALRNDLFAHRANWSASVKQVADAWQACDNMMAAASALAFELKWEEEGEGWGDFVARFRERVYATVHDFNPDLQAAAEAQWRELGFAELQQRQRQHRQHRQRYCPAHILCRSDVLSSLTVILVVVLFLSIGLVSWNGFDQLTLPTTPPPMLPFTKNPRFTGRDSALTQVAKALTGAPITPPQAVALASDDYNGHVAVRTTMDTLVALAENPWWPWPHAPASQPVCICGMGGIGKTSLAVEYAWQAHRAGAYPGGIFTVYAESLDDVVRSMHEIKAAITPHSAPEGPASVSNSWHRRRQQRGQRVNNLRAADLQDEVNSIWAQVRQYLALRCKLGEPWLLLIDNIEDERVLSTQFWIDLAATAPATPFADDGHQQQDVGCGHVLTTSRRTRLWHERDVKLVDLDTVDTATARRMLLLYSRQREHGGDHERGDVGNGDSLPQSENSALDDIVHQLQGLPLALHLAGSNIRETKCNFSTYARQFHAEPYHALRHVDDYDDLSMLLDRAGFDVLQQAQYQTMFLQNTSFRSMFDVLKVSPSTVLAVQLRDAGMTDADHVQRFVEALSSYIQRRKSIATAWHVSVQHLSKRARVVLDAWSLMTSDALPAGVFLQDIVDSVLAHEKQHAAAVHPRMYHRNIHGTISATSVADIAWATADLRALSLASREPCADSAKLSGQQPGGASSIVAATNCEMAHRVHRLVQLYRRETMSDESWVHTIIAVAGVLQKHLAPYITPGKLVVADIKSMTLVRHSLGAIHRFTDFYVAKLAQDHSTTTAVDTHILAEAVASTCALSSVVATMLGKVMHRGAEAVELLEYTARELWMKARASMFTSVRQAPINNVSDCTQLPHKEANVAANFSAEGAQVLVLLCEMHYHRGRQRSANNTCSEAFDVLSTVSSQRSRTLLAECQRLRSYLAMDMLDCDTAEQLMWQSLNMSAAAAANVPGEMDAMHWKNASRIKIQADFDVACGTLRNARHKKEQEYGLLQSAAETDPTRHVEVIDAISRNGSMYYNAGDVSAAVENFRRALREAYTVPHRSADASTNQPYVLAKELDLIWALLNIRGQNGNSNSEDELKSEFSNLLQNATDRVNTLTAQGHRHRLGPHPTVARFFETMCIVEMHTSTYRFGVGHRATQDFRAARQNCKEALINFQALHGKRCGVDNAKRGTMPRWVLDSEDDGGSADACGDAAHPDIARVLVHLGRAHEPDWREAEAFLHDAVQMYDMHLPTETASRGIAKVYLCYSLWKQQASGSPELRSKALECFSNVGNCSQRRVGALRFAQYHGWMASDLANIANTLQANDDSGGLRSAMSLWQCALALDPQNAFLPPTWLESEEYRSARDRSHVARQVFRQAEDMLVAGHWNASLRTFVMLARHCPTQLAVKRLLMASAKYYQACGHTTGARAKCLNAMYHCLERADQLCTSDGTFVKTCARVRLELNGVLHLLGQASRGFVNEKLFGDYHFWVHFRAAAGALFELQGKRDSARSSMRVAVWRACSLYRGVQHFSSPKQVELVLRRTAHANHELFPIGSDLAHMVQFQLDPAASVQASPQSSPPDHFKQSWQRQRHEMQQMPSLFGSAAEDVVGFEHYHWMFDKLKQHNYSLHADQSFVTHAHLHGKASDATVLGKHVNGTVSASTLRMWICCGTILLHNGSLMDAQGSTSHVTADDDTEHFTKHFCESVNESRCPSLDEFRFLATSATPVPPSRHPHIFRLAHAMVTALGNASTLVQALDRTHAKTCLIRADGESQVLDEACTSYFHGLIFNVMSVPQRTGFHTTANASMIDEAASLARWQLGTVKFRYGDHWSVRHGLLHQLIADDQLSVYSLRGLAHECVQNGMLAAAHYFCQAELKLLQRYSATSDAASSTLQEAAVFHNLCITGFHLLGHMARHWCVDAVELLGAWSKLSVCRDTTTPRGATATHDSDIQRCANKNDAASWLLVDSLRWASLLGLQRLGTTGNPLSEGILLAIRAELQRLLSELDVLALSSPTPVLAALLLILSDACSSGITSHTQSIFTAYADRWLALSDQHGMELRSVSVYELPAIVQGWAARAASLDTATTHARILSQLHKWTLCRCDSNCTLEESVAKACSESTNDEVRELLRFALHNQGGCEARHGRNHSLDILEQSLMLSWQAQDEFSFTTTLATWKAACIQLKSKWCWAAYEQHWLRAPFTATFTLRASSASLFKVRARSPIEFNRSVLPQPVSSPVIINGSPRAVPLKTINMSDWV